MGCPRLTIVNAYFKAGKIRYICGYTAFPQRCGSGILTNSLKIFSPD